MIFFSALWTSVAWVLAVLVPLIAVLSFGFSGQSSAEGAAGFFDPLILSVVKLTLVQAASSTAICVLMGYPLGLFLGKWLQFHPRSRIPTLMALPYGVSTLVAAMAWIILLGRNGVLSGLGIFPDWAYTLKAAILAHVFLNVPWVALSVAYSRTQVPLREIDASITLGGSSWQIYRFVTWPRVKWGLLSAAVQVFSLCVMSFTLVLILGGGPPVETLETLLYSFIRYRALDIQSAVICGLWEMVLTLAPWFVLIVFRRWAQHNEKGLKWGVHFQPISGVGPPLYWGWLLSGVAIFFILPYLVVFSAPLATWHTLALGLIRGDWFEALVISIELACLSAALSVLTAILAVFSLKTLPRMSPLRRLFETLLTLPSGLSILVLALGFWLAYGQWVDPFEGSLAAMASVQATVFFPLAFRILWPLSEIGSFTQLDAAFTLGASRFQVFRWVEWPRWRGPVVSSIAAVAGGSLAELGAVSFFYSEKLIPLPLLISRWMAKYRFDEAQGLAAFLLLVSCFLIFFAFRIGRMSEMRGVLR
ncbi:MAG: iron ABC transporter permease [Bdellovibrio sp.]|nr:iron ABC transporter permease [Bdellovibrio sp.]